jgi:hypothetical protein
MKALKVIISVFLSIFLFILVTAAGMVVIMRGAVSRQSIQTITRTIMSDIVIPDLLATPSRTTNNAAGDNGEVGNIENEPATFAGVILEVIDDSIIEDYNINEEAITGILENDAVADFIADIFADAGAFIMGEIDGGELMVTPDDIVEFMEENIQAIEEVIDYTFTEADFDDIREVLGDSMQELTWDNVMGDIVGDIERESPVNFNAIRSFLSLGMVIMLITAAAAVVAGIIMLNRHKGTKGLISCGIPCILSGGLIFAGNAFIGLIRSLILSDLGISAAQFNSLLSGVTNAVTLTGIVVSVTGAGFIIAAIIMANMNSSFKPVEPDVQAQ